jgi:hypothetical protein
VTRSRPPRRDASMPDDLRAALDTVSVADLRALVDDLLHELDPQAYARVVAALVDRAARNGSGWVPAAVDKAQVAAVLAFAKTTQREGWAEPSHMDAMLQRGCIAFFHRDYPTAHRIFDVLLDVIGDGLDLGQDELADEVLGTDLGECALQYIVSAYMIAIPTERAAAVRTALERVRGVAYLSTPLRDMERVAIEPLPGFEAFLPRWSALVRRGSKSARSSDEETDADAWRHEVVARIDGAEGLAHLARSTRRFADLRGWCRHLLGDERWEAARAACTEAAQLVTGRAHAGEFLDGAAHAAEQLGRRDVAAHLERAWRASPSPLRLLRWLGASNGGTTLPRRVAAALASCPPRAVCQRALLHVLRREFSAAADLLAKAPGLGWSDDEHPGHLLFSVFAQVLSSTAVDRGTTRAFAPEVAVLIERSGMERISDRASRAVVLAAMKTAAEKRVAELTQRKRRRHYRHAAELVAICVACDATRETRAWAAALRAGHRRFIAFVAELDRAMGAS